MHRIKNWRRQRLYCLICAILFGILSFRLFYLQCVEGAELTEIALSQSGRLVYDASPRGSILDRYGRVLAQSVSVPEIRLHPSEVPREDLNETILDACTLLVSSGETLSCTLPLTDAANGASDVAFETPELSDFQAALKISSGTSASDAYKALCKKLDIPDSFSVQEALSAAAVLLAAHDQNTVLVNEAGADDVRSLQTAGGERFSCLCLHSGDLAGSYDIELDPDMADSLDARAALDLYKMIEKKFSVACGPGSASLPIARDASTGKLAWETPEIKQLRSDLKLDAAATAQDCFAALIRLYGIPKNTATRSALAVAAVRFESSRQGTPANHSILLAADVSEAAVAAVKRLAGSLPGIRIEQGWVREYPEGTLLSPVLGHIGRITAEQAQTYSALGYDLNTDLVGRDGLEKQYETFLRGVPSVTSVEVDAWGRPVNEQKVSDGEAGQDVLLTIDADIQRVAEESLAQTMKDIQSGRLGHAYPSANVGAAVAIDVRTGEVLCMTSLPNYDPNLFATGTISQADWEVLSPRYFEDGTLFEDTDPTLSRPLVNNAVSTAFPPGSTFKMVVATAGLAEGAIEANEKIEDKGRYMKYSEINAPTCWLYSSTGQTHGFVDMEEALAVSCNYYFYTLGDRLGADAIEKYARKYGMGEKTGIDLPSEAAGSVDSASYYVASLEKKVYNRLKSALPKANDAMLKKTSREMAGDTTLTQVIARLKSLNVTDKTLQYELNDLIQAYRYRPANVLSSAIGQGGHTTTLIQMATYTAQIANGGTRVVPRLFAGTANDTPAAPAPASAGSLGVSQSVLDTIRAGMEKAVSTGTASSVFKNCALSVAGKTGSAQMGGKDACAWFVGYAPANDPQIAVAVVIAQGGQGTYAAPVGRAILEACFDSGTGTPLTRRTGLTP